LPADQADLEARLRCLEDTLEIQQLFIDYGRHLDRGDFESYAELFTEDGEILLGPVARAKGRAEIRATMESTLGGHVGDTVHIISSPVIHLDGDVATSEVMWTVVALDAAGAAQVTMVGRHIDDLAREDGRWRIERRKGLLDLPAAMPNRP
jgi:uncharacterized protein (TIGR02246 family)